MFSAGPCLALSSQMTCLELEVCLGSPPAAAPSVDERPTDVTPLPSAPGVRASLAVATQSRSMTSHVGQLIEGIDGLVTHAWHRAWAQEGTRRLILSIGLSVAFHA